MKSAVRLFVLVSFAQSFTAAALDAADAVVWPGWLGPEHNGWVGEFPPPDQWPDKLVAAWKHDVGIGYGSPLVTEQRVIQHARQGDDEVLWCFDRTTGDIIWRSAWNVPFQVAGGGERHGKGPKSSPVLADGRVFTMSLSGELRAWNAANGNLIWRSDYGSNFRQSHPNWGASTSPIVDGHKVIVHFGTDDEGALTALDVKSGSVIWSLKGDGASYSSPVLAELGGVPQLVEWNHEALIGVDTATGTELWRFPFPHEHHNQNMPTPVIYRESVLLGGENRGIRSVSPRLQNGQWSVTVSWEQNDVALDMSTAVINKDLLYGYSHYGKGRLFCLNPSSGEVVWQGPGRTGENVTFLSVPGSVLALINNGELRIIKAGAGEYELTRSLQVGDDWTWSPPVLLKDGLLVKDRNSLTFWKL